MRDELCGWMALLAIDGEECQTWEDANQAAAALGWALEDENAQVAPDAEAGCWMVRVTPDDFSELDAEGGISKTVMYEGHSISGEIETP
jgi:hypothetical protein